MRALEELLLEELTRKLTAAGWTRAPGGQHITVFVKKVSDEVVAQAAVDLSVTDYGIGINPSLAVQHPETSRLSRQFTGRPPTGGPGVGTIGCSLAYLLTQNGYDDPTRTRWFASSADDLGRVTDLLCEDIGSYGSAFFQPLSTLSDIISRLQDKSRSQPQTGFLAIASALAGKRPEALVALAEYAAEAETQLPPMSTQSWTFVRSFVQHFGIEESSLPYNIPS